MKVILIGKGYGWADAPMEGETWGVNDLIVRRPVKKLFLMHRRDANKYSSSLGLSEKVIQRINELKTPVVAIEDDGFLPNVEIFPLEEMPYRYFTSSIAYMIAYAIYKEATSIEMYGVTLRQEEEYLEQIPCIEFWFGVAVGRGIEIIVHGDGNLFKSHWKGGLYGYSAERIPA